MSGDRSDTPDFTYRLLAGIDLDGRRAIIAASRQQPLRPSQVLYHAGEPAEHLFALRTGRVQFARLGSKGHEVILGILGPSDIFGLGSLVSRHNYLATAEALDHGEALVWTHDVIGQFADRYPHLARNALQIALDYTSAIAERHETLLMTAAGHRVALALTRLGSRTGAISPAGVEVRIKNEQLASLADVSVFTVSRMLKQWERSGAIRKYRGSVLVLNPEKLLVE